MNHTANHSAAKANTRALRAVACIELNQASKQTLLSALAEVSDWAGYFQLSEQHGLSPLLYHHLSQLDFALDKAVNMQLKALVIRHRRAHEIRSEIITEFLNAFQQADVHSALLKGAALAHILYPLPSMRPMGDVDVLVATEQALLAQQTLRDLGYSAGDRKEGYLYDHHHLPVASNHKEGMDISIEVHHDALSGDVAHSIAMHNVSQPLQCFEIDGITAHAFNHTDMLRHLCHHTFEPAETIKLGSIVDLVGYANRFVDQIDWHQLQQQHAFIQNTLRCVHFLAPLPTKLAEKISAPAGTTPVGVGQGFIPLSEVINRQQSKFKQLRTLLQPSAWWMHIFYVVPPEKSLLWVRFFRHPWQVAKWLYRRYRAAWRSKAEQA